MDGRANGLAGEMPHEEAARRFKGDRAFIAEVEGGLWTAGYLPRSGTGEPIGRSGVTIGVGVDLGHQTEEGLRRLGVDAELLARIRPYLGKVREEALQYLMANPLFLSKDEAADLTSRVHNGIIADVAGRYGRASGVDFYDLPSESQTVIASIAIQYGANLARPAREGGTPRFWRFVTSGDWYGASEELRDFGDRYAPRRLHEARLLERVVPAADGSRAFA